MTDLDAPPSRTRAVGVAARPGVWRALSFVVVAAVAAIVTVWILQSRAASDVAARNSRTLELRSADVFVDDLQLPGGAQVAVLGFDPRNASPIGVAGTTLDIPNNAPALVALLDPTGGIHGLRLVTRPEDREQIVINPVSTAHALLVLSPAFLEADIERARQKVEFIDDDPAFAAVAQAIAGSPNFGAANPQVEQSLAAILDRVRGANPMFDQGCDSILNPAARTVSGTCVVPSSSGATINNEQDRWVLAFAGPEPYLELCGAVAPAGTPGSQRSVSRGDCGDRALLAAPGPIVDRAADQAEEIARVQAATAVQTFASYAAPLADLAGGAAGLNQPSNTHVLSALSPLVGFATERISDDAGFPSSLDVIISSATPLERHAATIAASRVLLEDPGGFIEGWDGAASVHGRLLDFYDRVGEQMADADRSEWRWTADATGVAQLGGGS